MHKLIYFLLILLVACAPDGKKSSELKPNEIYKNFTVTYDENKKELEAQAQFLAGASWDRNMFEKTGGTAVELDAPANIIFTGKAMEKAGSLFTGRLYIYKQEKPVPLVSWKYTDQTGKSYDYLVKVIPISFKKRLSNINYKKDLKIYWEGKPVQENEWVELVIEGEVPVDSNETKKVELLAVAGEPGDEYVRMDSRDLTRLKKCNVKVTIIRKTHIALPDLGREEGFLNVEYIGRSFDAKIPEEGMGDGIFGL